MIVTYLTNLLLFEANIFLLIVTYLKQLSALQVNPEEDWLAISSFSYFLLRGRIIYSMSFEFEAYGTKPQSQRGSFFLRLEFYNVVWNVD